MKTKTEQLEELFCKWEKEHETESEENYKLTKSPNELVKKDFFERDGIICEKIFESQRVDGRPLRVLFITAEANVTDPKQPHKTNYKDHYIAYKNSEDGKDDWKGKMRERICALYQVVAKQKPGNFPNEADKFAVMDLNKRGGGANIGDGKHIEEYVRIYKENILRELQIINPTIVIWIGTNTYDMGIPGKLDAKSNGKGLYFEIDGQQIPIIRMWQTSYYRGRIPSLNGYTNRTIGKLCAKLQQELGKFDL